jgi:outer membrane protein assembly factor BamB
MSRFLTCFLLLIGTAHAAEGWPEFRGPTGQGLSSAKKLPTEWNGEHRRNIAWRQAIPGRGWSSPVIHDGKIYLTTAVPTGEEGDLSSPQSLRSLCLDAESGKILWDKEVFTQKGAKTHDKNSHASPTPITDGKFLYVHFGTHGTACLDLEGQIIWESHKLIYDPEHGNGGSPALGGKALVISCDGTDKQFVVALDRRSGDELWRRARPPNSGRGFSFSTPLIIEVGGMSQVISSGSDYVVSYDLEEGDEVWRFNYPNGYSVVPRPVFAHGLVYVCSGFGSQRIWAISPDGKGDVTKTHLKWQRVRSVPLNASPLIAGEELYTVSDEGIASCLDAKSGEEKWQKRLEGHFSASPLYAAGKIYFTSEDGETFVIEAGKKEGEILGRCPLGERTLASFAVSGGAIFIRTEKGLWRVGPTPANPARQP